MSESEGAPMLRVVRGNPDDVELAALTAVLAAATSSEGSPGSERKERRSRWADPAASMHRLPHPGPGAWRASAFPR
ncbi:acyl-CoA carboxylase subunit epsilon [Amycolatopsis cihanbeyliensis]|uniref:Acyl-CoA carboxylase epsilon subunit-like protein n=1 Tax=Amycolatopsis cihanbeyliensis TaxID=1128664 RepID=A0A542DP65_AMYCI|nr:acyl-CoA carboxylase subunit epsilon [Amycolatopsis cihanbeyliensis]TQJ04755.1 acyl-CoA carboxylase epsilon subunit-like protein [Amycolatopsis cihanbeyliensis]